jgi:S1-C subfamily serine protease
MSLLTALVLALGVGLVSAKTTSTSHRSGAWLGVYTQSVDDEMAEGFKLASKTGAIINEVVQDSPADEAGLRENDIVISLDGGPIKTADEMINLIRDHKVGDEVTLKVLRDGKEREFKVTLADRKPSSDDAEWSFNAPKGAKTQVFKFFSDESSDSYIGVELTSLSDQLRAYFGVTGDGGVLVSSVEKETPANKAGLKAGDVIIKADGNEVTDANDVREVVADKDKGAKVELTLVRDRKEMTVAVEVAENEHAEHGRKSMRSFSMPDMGHMQTPNMPRMKGLWYGTEDRNKSGDDLRDELESLRKELNELRDQLNELRQSKK